MAFRKLFPATDWFWRHATSRRARRIYIWVLAIVLIPAIGLRIEAAFFALRVHRVMSGLSSLRIGETSKVEALSRIPDLKIVKGAEQDSSGASDEWFSVAIPNSPLSEWVLLSTGRAGHKTLYSLLSWYGLRFWGLNADVSFNSGKVSAVGYRLMLSTPYPQAPGAVMIGVFGSAARNGFADWSLGHFDWHLDESPDYLVYHHWKAPDLNTGVYFTRDAPPDLVKHAFDLHLACLGSLAGCETANQLLPGPEQDRLAIERAANDRMRGPDQCPDRILPGRARNVEDISLVEVTTAGPVIPESETTYAHRIASFRLLRVLKGKPWPLENISVSRDVGLYGDVRVHNSAVELLNPGQRLLLFSDGSADIRQPCQAVAATDTAVQTMERALSGMSSR